MSDRKPGYLRTLLATTAIGGGVTLTTPGCDKKETPAPNSHVAALEDTTPISAETRDIIQGQLDALEGAMKAFNNGQGLNAWIDEQIKNSGTLQDKYCFEGRRWAIGPVFAKLRIQLLDGKLTEAAQDLKEADKRLSDFFADVQTTEEGPTRLHAVEDDIKRLRPTAETIAGNIKSLIPSRAIVSNETIETLIEKLHDMETKTKAFNNGQGLQNWISQQIENSPKLRARYIIEGRERAIAPDFEAIEKNLRDGKLQAAAVQLMAAFERIGGFEDDMLVCVPTCKAEFDKVGKDLTAMSSFYQLALDIQDALPRPDKSQISR